MDAHGGYLCRLESLDGPALVQLAQRALASEGGALRPLPCTSRSSPGARSSGWRTRPRSPLGARAVAGDQQHQLLASIVSAELRITVHAYVVLPDQREEVVGYGNGRKVGGERLVYDQVELPDGELDDVAFAKLQSKWPLGHLAYVFGVSGARSCWRC